MGDRSLTSPSGLSTMSSAIRSADGYACWIIETFSSDIGRRVLDVGMGYGQFKQHLGESEIYVGIDVDDGAIARARQTDPRGVYLQADVGSDGFADQLRSMRFDTILCLNLLEHIPDDRKAVRNMIDLLESDGRLLLLVPCSMRLYNDLDRLAGHLRRYSPTSLMQLFEGTQCRITLMRRFNALGAVGWFVNGLIGVRDLDQPKLNRQIRLFDRIGVPVSKRIDPWARRFFGQSLVAVARKS